MIERHTLGNRFIHWTHALFMLFLLVTGWGIYTGTYILWTYAENLSLHMLAGIGIVIVSIGLKIYMFITDRHELRMEWLGLDDIKRFITVATNFLGITKKYPEYHVYDKEKKQYLIKYHPAMKFIVWGDFAILLGMAITGFGMYWPATVLGLITNYMSMTLIRTLHLAFFYYFVFSLIAHIYLSILPVNWHILRSMVFGEDTGEDTIMR